MADDLDKDGAMRAARLREDISALNNKKPPAPGKVPAKKSPHEFVQDRMRELAIKKASDSSTE